MLLINGGITHEEYTTLPNEETVKPQISQFLQNMNIVRPTQHIVHCIRGLLILPNYLCLHKHFHCGYNRKCGYAILTSPLRIHCYQRASATTCIVSGLKFCTDIRVVRVHTVAVIFSQAQIWLSCLSIWKEVNCLLCLNLPPSLPVIMDNTAFLLLFQITPHRFSAIAILFFFFYAF